MCFFFCVHQHPKSTNLTGIKNVTIPSTKFQVPDDFPFSTTNHKKGPNYEMDKAFLPGTKSWEMAYWWGEMSQLQRGSSASNHRAEWNLQTWAHPSFLCIARASKQIKTGCTDSSRANACVWMGFVVFAFYLQVLTNPATKTQKPCVLQERCSDCWPTSLRDSPWNWPISK